MTNSALTVTESHSGNVCVVALTGRIDSSNANDFLARLNGLISSGEKSILVDFANVLYLTSAAFRVLLVATDEAERKAARFALCSLAGQVRAFRAGLESGSAPARGDAARPPPLP